MKSKCIIFTGYNRVGYLNKTLDAWADVRGLEEYDIYFKIEPSDRLGLIMESINRFKSKVNSSVEVLVNETVLGCAKNSWEAIDFMFQRYQFVILAEDDIVPSKDIAEFFTYLENKYRDDEEVAIISANNEVEGFDSVSISKIGNFRVHIWGTWKDTWNKYIRDTWDFDYSSGVQGGPSGWDWNLTLRVLPDNNLKSIAPHSSRSQHIGENGIHCTPEIYKDMIMKSFNEDYSWKELVEV